MAWRSVSDRCHACSQLMFVSGVALTIGPQATLRFFIRKKNLKVGLHSCFSKQRFTALQRTMSAVNSGVLLHMAALAFSIH